MKLSKVQKIVLTSFLLLTGTIYLLHTPDIPLEKLKSKYTYNNSQFIDVMDMNVHYRINGQGPTLLLVHGTAASLHTWEDWTSQLEKDFQVISLDIPAYGLTGPHPNRSYKVDNYVEFLSAFAKKLRLDSFSLAGNSLGGLIAWNYAARHPDQIQKLILIDPSGFSQKKPASLAFRLAKNKFSSKILRYITPKSLFQKSLKEVYFDESKLKPDLLNRYYDLGLRTGNRQAFIDRANTKQNIDLSRLQRIQAPTLIMWGKQDAWIPVEHAAQFQSAIKNAEVLIYDRAGHIPMEEIPELTVKDAISFLKN
ncbi:MAG: alpha/beta hydrolase [Saprospiraceae bacterium]|nr:alpha/beta hydrolase [Saprospiraceae bacterium]